jgi:hypothetical protein
MAEPAPESAAGPFRTAGRQAIDTEYGKTLKLL